VIGVAAKAAAVAAIALVAAGAVPTARVLTRNDRTLWRFALDGSRITWAPLDDRLCVTPSTWDLYRGGWVVTRPGNDCYDDAIAVAMAGSRIAWITFGASLSSGGFALYAGSVGGRAKNVLATDAPIDSITGDSGGLDSEELGDLVGGGSTIAYATWTVHPNRTVADETVWSLAPGGPQRLGAVPLLRSLALEPDGTVVALRGDATVQFLHEGIASREVRLTTATSSIQPRRDLDLALSGGTAYVLGLTSIQAFDLATGESTATWPLPAIPARSRGLLTAGGGYVAYLQRAVIHVLRVKDGKTVSVPATRMQPSRCGGGDMWAMLGDRGLVYTAGPGSRCVTTRAGLIAWDELAGYF
jgi:hypothetical protein